MKTRELSKQLAGALQPHMSKKNQLNRMLFAGHTGNTPVVLDDKPTTYIQDGYMMNPDVYSVVNIRSRAASAVPAMVMEVKDEKAARQYYRFKQSQRNGVQEGYKEKKEELQKKAFEEVDENDDLYKLIERPNPLQAWPEFFENLWGFLDVTGNGYVHGVELTDRRIGEMWIMPPQMTRIKADKSLEGLVRAYILEYYGQMHDIPAETVMHLKYWNPDYATPGSHLYGMSPLRSAMQAVRAGNDGAQALSSSYQNMGAEGMAFPDDKDVDSLTDQQRDALSREIQNAAGPRYKKSVLVTSVKMGWQKFGMSPVDLEILSALNLSMRKICNIYGISSELLNDPENKTQANKREARRGMYMDVVIPQMERAYAELNRWLCQPYTDSEGVKRPARFNNKRYHIDYDVSAIEALGDDMAKKVDWLSRAWWLTLNERRQAIDYDESDNPVADELWAPTGQMPIGELSFGDNVELRELVDNYGMKIDTRTKDGIGFSKPNGVKK